MLSRHCYCLQYSSDHHFGLITSMITLFCDITTDQAKAESWKSALAWLPDKNLVIKSFLSRKYTFQILLKFKNCLKNFRNLLQPEQILAIFKRIFWRFSIFALTWLVDWTVVWLLKAKNIILWKINILPGKIFISLWTRFTQCQKDFAGSIIEWLFIFS